LKRILEENTISILEENMISILEENTWREYD